MARQPPKGTARARAKTTAKETARKAQDIAGDVLQMSTMTVVSRSKATVLQLEARKLQASLDKKKSQESGEDAERAQQLLKDVAGLRDAQRAKIRASETHAKKKVLVVDAPKEERRSVDQPNSPEDVGVGIRDESVKDEESRALLRRASTFAPVTGPAVNMPDEDIAAIVAQKLEEKSHSSPASHRSPAMSTESIGLRAKATDLAATSTQSPVAPGPTSPAMSKKLSLTSSKRTVQATPKRVSPATSMKSIPAISKNPSPTPAKDMPMSSSAGSPSTAKRNSPDTSKQPSPVPSQLNIESVRKQRTKARTSSARDVGCSSRQPRITPSMLREKEELDDVIKNLLKSADAGAGEGNPATLHTSFPEGLIATLLGSDTRSGDSDHPYSTLRRNARKKPLQFCVRICCSLALLALAVALVAATLAYGNRAFAKHFGDTGAEPQASAQNSTGAQGDDQQQHNQPRQSNDVDHGLHAGSFQEVTSIDVHGTTNATAEAPYYNDLILDIW